MKRRDSLKYIAASALASAAIATGCSPAAKKEEAKATDAAKPGIHRLKMRSKTKKR